MAGTLSFAGQNNKWNTADDAKPVVEAIESASELRCLDLEANTLGVEAARVIGDALAKHPEFERAHWKDLFTGRLKEEIPKALRHLFSGVTRAGAKLLELDLSDNALGPIGVEGMVEFMSSPSCYSLQELRLNNNGLGIKGGTMLADSLMQLEAKSRENGIPLQLKIFIVGRNRLEKEGAKAYAELFRRLGTLEEVSLPQNGIRHEGITALAKALSANPHLRLINLNDNIFTPIGAKAMADELKSMQNLEVINFGDCLIKTAGAISLAKALTDAHVKLRELYLDGNEIAVDGGLEMVKAMANKVNLTCLMLDANQFGEKGCEHVQSFLEQMGQLEALDSLENDEGEPDEEEEEEEGEGEEEEEVSEEEEHENDDIHQEEVPVEPAEVLPIKCTVEDFCNQPSAGRLLGLGNDAPEQLLKVAKDIADPQTPEGTIIACFHLLMKTAGIAVTTDNRVTDQVHRVTEELAKEVFTQAHDEDLMGFATNTLLVHVGLIKSEDKNFKLEWDLRGVVITLCHLVALPMFPKQFKDSLSVFLSCKQNPKVDCYSETHKLRQALFK